MIAVMLFFSVFTKAETVSNPFNDANKLYEQGRFSEAAAGYEKMVQNGSVSTPLLFNLGNAFLKSGQVGRAIVAYRRAEKLSPRDPDVRANLQFARNQAGGGTAAPTHRWKNFIEKMTLNEWAISTSVLVSLWFLLLALREWRGKKSFRGIIFALGIICGLFAVCLVAAIRQEFFVQSLVVIVPEAVVRRGTFEESPSVFTLRDGAEVTVLDKNNGWLQIVDAAHRSGWLLEKQLSPLDKSERR